MLPFLLLSMNLAAALFATSAPEAASAVLSKPAAASPMIGADKPVFLGRLVVTATPLPDRQIRY